MTMIQWTVAIFGALLMLGAFTLRGTYNEPFVRTPREPDNPPTRTARVALFVGGVAVVWCALTGRV